MKKLRSRFVTDQITNPQLMSEVKHLNPHLKEDIFSGNAFYRKPENTPSYYSIGAVFYLLNNSNNSPILAGSLNSIRPFKFNNQKFEVLVGAKVKIDVDSILECHQAGLIEIIRPNRHGYPFPIPDLKKCISKFPFSILITSLNKTDSFRWVITNGMSDEYINHQPFKMECPECTDNVRIDNCDFCYNTGHVIFDGYAQYIGDIETYERDIFLGYAPDPGLPPI